MKTTIDIPDALLEAVRELVWREGTTLKALVTAGLRRELAERSVEHQPFVLGEASLSGEGLQAEAADLSWPELIDLSYGVRRE